MEGRWAITKVTFEVGVMAMIRWTRQLMIGLIGGTVCVSSPLTARSTGASGSAEIADAIPRRGLAAAERNFEAFGCDRNAIVQLGIKRIG